MANHSRWCEMNPSSGPSRQRLAIARAAIKTHRNQYVCGVQMSAITKDKIKRAATGRVHSPETKERLREQALKSPHRRLKRAVTSYRGVLLDSSWEVALARRLDELGVQWIRPEPLPWTDDMGIRHHYFPDFYLPDFDLYIDPKNPQAFKQQRSKLNCLRRQYSNLLILATLEACVSFDPTFTIWDMGEK